MERLTEKDENFQHIFSLLHSWITFWGQVTVIETQIDGEFEGWEGETIFKLMNGQIRKQSSYDYLYHYAYCPNVIIYKTSTGYFMKVEGVDEKISVVQLN